MALRFRPRDLLLPAIVLVPALFAAVAGPATAQSVPNGQATQMVRACGADIQKLCAGLQPGDGRIMRCMKAHEAELSNGCKATLSSLQSQQTR